MTVVLRQFHKLFQADETAISSEDGENMEEKHKLMDFELCDYDEGFSRLEASDIGWCGTCKIPDCPYNKNLEEKRRLGFKHAR